MNVLNAIRRFYRWFLLGFIYAGCAWADLPAIEQPSSGGSGGTMDTVKGYIKDGFSLAGLLLAAVAFLVVAMAALSSFHDVREGKAKWPHFVTFVVVGAVLIVLIIWLANKALTIF
jgi:integrating conjugative element membrane protein (TIGR03745 family)